jgi:TonB family protein
MLATIGHGGGGGSGSGYGYGSMPMVGHAAASVPSIRAGAAMVRGSLSREVIRRTIRLHINAVRGVYERQLLRDPSLTGRVEVQFVIGPSGNVVSATVASSTIGSTEVEQGVLGVLRNIQFPAPEGGGTHIVTYPFVFVPAGD